MTETEQAKGARIVSPEGTLWHVEYLPCPVCGSEEKTTLGARGGRAHRSGRGIETDVVRCRNCGILYTWPTLLPDSNPYATINAEEYFALSDPQQKAMSGERHAAFAERILGRAGSLLELGCGRGEFLEGAARRGWAVRGVDMTEEYAAAARARGIDVECCAIQTCQLLRETYDVILLAAILEHLYNPMEVLLRVRDALRPDGLIFVDVPNEASLAARAGNLYVRARGKDWVVNLSPTFAPFHVLGFSPTSLRTTLDRAGFSVLRLNTWKWNNLVPPGRTFLGRAERSAFGVLQSIGARMGLGDGISCWARRR